MLVLVHFKGLNSPTDHTKMHTSQLQVLDVVVTNHSKTDYSAYIGNSWYLKTAY